jgi:hypothetical protein
MQKWEYMTASVWHDNEKGLLKRTVLAINESPIGKVRLVAETAKGGEPIGEFLTSTLLHMD